MAKTTFAGGETKEKETAKPEINKRRGGGRKEEQRGNCQIRGKWETQIGGFRLGEGLMGRPLAWFS